MSRPDRRYYTIQSKYQDKENNQNYSLWGSETASSNCQRKFNFVSPDRNYSNLRNLQHAIKTNCQGLDPED